MPLCIPVVSRGEVLGYNLYRLVRALGGRPQSAIWPQEGRVALVVAV